MSAGPGTSALDAQLRARLTRLFLDGHAIWDRFDTEVRRHEWHPFVPADYKRVLQTLIPLRRPGLRFLEWGSATGVITIMADMLGFEACGIEIDDALVRIARELAARHDSNARFATGSFLPDDYAWKSNSGDPRLGTIGNGPSGYAELGRSLAEFDIIFGYPWGGEEPMMHDLIVRVARPDALFLLNAGARGIELYRAGERVRE